MDDIIILTETRQQYVKARRRLFVILRELRLTVSPHKTRVGALNRGFHFLGVNFEVTRIPQRKIQKVSVDVHPRTPRRFIDKATALSALAVHPAHIQRYLTRWAFWWSLVTGLETSYLIRRWASCAAQHKPALSRLGRGLLIPPSSINERGFVLQH